MFQCNFLCRWNRRKNVKTFLDPIQTAWKFIAKHFSIEKNEYKDHDQWNFNFKFKILWGGHKIQKKMIMKNFAFWNNYVLSPSTKRKTFINCGLLRISELYQSMIIIYNFTCYNIKPNIIYIKKHFPISNILHYPYFLIALITYYLSYLPILKLLQAGWYWKHRDISICPKNQSWICCCQKVKKPCKKASHKLKTKNNKEFISESESVSSTVMYLKQGYRNRCNLINFGHKNKFYVF